MDDKLLWDKMALRWSIWLFLHSFGIFIFKKNTVISHKYIFHGNFFEPGVLKDILVFYCVFGIFMVKNKDMKYIHNFENETDFLEEYNGDGYIEPWVSYTKELDTLDSNVAYNKSYPYDVLVENNSVIWHRLKRGDFSIGDKIKVLWTYNPSEAVFTPKEWVYIESTSYLGYAFYNEDYDFVIAFDPETDDNTLKTYGTLD